MIPNKPVFTETLTTPIINEMVQVIEQEPFDAAIKTMIKRWPQYRFIVCSEHDMGEKKPFRALSQCSLFLIAASLGCASLTNDPQQSVGLIVAEYDLD